MPEDPTMREDVEAILELPSTVRILDAVCALTGLRFAAIARVTPGRWITCASRDDLDYGFRPGDELDATSTLCLEVRDCGQVIVIEDVAKDEVYRDHHVPRKFGFRSYISVPITLAGGEFFGTLCGFDPDPRELKTPAVLETFALFADLIAAQLDARRDLVEQRRELKAERAFGRLREEFLAVLGHDLRNPVAAILAGQRVLERHPLDEQSAEVIKQIGASATRMNNMIERLLDLARARLGGGIPVKPKPEPALQEEFEQVISEIRATSDREIRCEFEVGTIVCDRSRMGELLSNLVGNAVVHGAPEGPVEIKATERDGVFQLSVTNSGQIPERMRRSLFRPFHRGQNDTAGGGLGLGLYIASEIAKAHGGKLVASSGDKRVTFSMTMPLVPRKQAAAAPLTNA